MNSLSPATSAIELTSSHSKPSLLACVRLLKLHFENEGVDMKGFDMLHRMIQMTSAIGWEVHVMFCSKIPSTGSFRNIRWYVDCILQGCEVFRSNMAASVRKALSVSASLLEFEKSQVGVTTTIKCWKDQLSTLHKPTGNDRRLFELMLNHYNEAALQRLLRLNARKPHYGLEMLLESAKSVYVGLEELHCLAKQADDIVLTLEQDYDAAIDRLERDGASEASPQQRQTSLIAQDQEHLPATAYRPPEDRHPAKANIHLSKSFGVAEEELARRGHTRAATFSDTRYTAVDASNHGNELTTTQSLKDSTLCARRKGINVPRIFTGSFSQLESDLRRLQLDKVDTPVTQNIDRDDPVKVRDFGATPAATPAISPCTTPSLASLQRREAMVSRDIEFQDRLINGEVVKSRRPSTKTRAQTIDDGSNALEAWLKEERPGKDAADTNNSAVHRCNFKQRERTL